MSTRTSGRHLLVNRGILLLIVLLMLYPIIFVVFTSLKDTKDFYTNIWGLPDNLAWSNYSTAWQDAHIGSYFLTTFYIVGITVILANILSITGGYALAKLNIPKAELIMILLLASNMLPSEIIIMPLYLGISKLGFIGTRTSLIIPYIGWSLPVGIYIYKEFFMSIPGELLESARMDGASETKTFIKIIMPLMYPALATVVILTFVAWWGELIWATVALSSTSTIRTLSLGILSFQGQFGTNWGPLSAAICIILLPLMIIFLMLQKYFVQGVTGGAVKG